LQKNQTLYAFTADTEFTYYEIQKEFNYYFNCSFTEYEQKLKMLKAAANNWMINASQYTTHSKFTTQKPLDTSINKRYDEPL